MTRTGLKTKINEALNTNKGWNDNKTYIKRNTKTGNYRKVWMIKNWTRLNQSGLCKPITHA